MNHIKNVSTVTVLAMTLVFGALFLVSSPTAFAFGTGGDGGCCGSTGSTGSGSGGMTTHGGYTPPPVHHYSAPTCSLSVNPSQVTYGGSDSISWSTSNATSVSLSGFGSVSLSGSQTDSNITSGKTYVLTASGQGGTVTCTKSVTVKIQQCPTNYTGTYPNCVPITCPAGYTGTYPNCTIPSCPANYTGTYPNCVPITCPSGYAGTYPNCTIPVCPSGYTGVYPSCTPPPTYNYPSCNIYINQYNQNNNYNQYQYQPQNGQGYVINWSSQYATYGYINNGVGSVNLSGSQTVYPTQTTIYTGTFYGQNGQQVTCSVTINVNNYVPPIVYQNPAPYITLSAVPYTGLDLGPVGTIVYWGFLIAWCLFAAYLIAVKRIHMSIFRWYKKALFGEDVHVAPVAEVSFAGFTQADLSKLASMIRGGSTPAHSAHLESAVDANDSVDPFILSQINRKSH